MLQPGNLLVIPSVAARLFGGMQMPGESYRQIEKIDRFVRERGGGCWNLMKKKRREVG